MCAALASYPHRLAGHCASGAFRDLFEYRGLHHGEPLSEAMVFGLGAGLDVMFMPRPAGFYLGGRSALLEESLLARVGGALSRRAESDDAAAWAFVRERLDRGEPVAMVGDCAKLDYLRTRTSMPLHVIVAVGYDATHALIADNDRAAVQRCALDSLARARAARGFPLPAMNVTFEIAWPASLPAIASMVRGAIAEAAASMREPVGLPAEIFGRDAFGLRALDRLEHAARTWDDDGAAVVAARAAALWIAIEKAGTGGALFRNLWRDFLREARDALPASTALRAAHAHYAQLADAWGELGARCAAGDGARAGAAVTRIARAEREGHALLERVAGEQG